MVPFGFTNALATSMFLVNNVFGKFLNRLVLVLLDGVLISSKNELEHVDHLRLTLKLLRKHNLYAGLRKYDFYRDRINYLGHIISHRGKSGDPENIEAMMSRPASRKITDVRSFVGLTGHCRKFTKGYSAGKVEPRYTLERPSCELIVP